MSKKTIKKAKRITMKQLARETMRGCAMGFREWTAPASFDGTLGTYHRNINMAMNCLVAAKELRDLSQQKA